MSQASVEVGGDGGHVLRGRLRVSVAPSSLRETHVLSDGHVCVCDVRIGFCFEKSGPLSAPRGQGWKDGGPGGHGCGGGSVPAPGGGGEDGGAAGLGPRASCGASARSRPRHPPLPRRVRPPRPRTRPFPDGPVGLPLPTTSSVGIKNKVLMKHSPIPSCWFITVIGASRDHLPAPGLPAPELRPPAGDWQEGRSGAGAVLTRRPAFARCPPHGGHESHASWSWPGTRVRAGPGAGG